MITPEESWVLFDGSTSTDVITHCFDGPENHLSVMRVLISCFILEMSLYAAHHGFCLVADKYVRFRYLWMAFKPLWRVLR